MGKELHKMMVEGILVPMETVLKLIQWSVLYIRSGLGFLDAFPAAHID